MYPTKLCLGLTMRCPPTTLTVLPKQLTPPPLSQPKSPVKVKAALSRSLRDCRSTSPRCCHPCESAYGWVFPVRRYPGRSYSSNRHPAVRAVVDLPPEPGFLLNLPYDCQPLMNHGSIFNFAVGNTCRRTPLKNHGVFDDT